MRARPLAFLLLVTAGVASLAAQTLRIHTDRGEIEAQLLPDVAPRFASAFTRAVRAGHYDSLRCEPVDGQYLRLTPTSKPDFTSLPWEVNPTALGLDTLLVRQSWYGHLLPSGHALQDSTVATLLRRQGYTFTPDLPSVAPARGTLAAVHTPETGYTGQIVLVLDDAAADWLRGRCLVFGRMDSAGQLTILWEKPASPQECRIRRLQLP